MSQVVLFGDSAPENPKTPAIYVLASYLRNKGISAQPIWAWLDIRDIEFKLLCKKYITAETKVVGISTTVLVSSENSTEFYGVSAEVFEQRVQFIKSINPNIKIVLGGSKIRHQGKKPIPKIELVDYVVSGQGEESLLWIAKNADKPVADKFLSDVEIPFDDFNTSPVKFDPQDCIQQNEGLFIEFARGCIFKCGYCSYHLNGKKRGDFTKGSDVLKSELIRNYEMFGTQHYYVSDDLINDNPEKIEDLWNMTQQLPFKIYYGGYTRLDLIWKYPQMARQLKESGLISTFFGIETINDKSGKAVGKGLGVERTNEALETCRKEWKREVSVQGAFILGLPHDTPDTKYELMEWLDRPEIRDVMVEVYVNPLHIHPMTTLSDMSANPAKYGYHYKDSAGKISPLLFNNSPHYGGNWFTKDYSYQQAVADAKEVYDHFYRNTKYQYRLKSFSLPLYLSLTEHKQDVLDVVLHDKSTRWATNDEWASEMVTLYRNLRKNYMKQLLTK